MKDGRHGDHRRSWDARPAPEYLAEPLEAAPASPDNDRSRA
jgi:hypothetical protein